MEKLHPPSEFWIDFIATLRSSDNFDILVDSPEVANEIMNRALTIGISQWGTLKTTAGYGGLHQTLNLKHATRLFDLCLSSNQAALAGILVRLMLDRTSANGAIESKFLNSFYNSLIPEVRRLMNTHCLSPGQDPFGRLFRGLIECYMCKVLGEGPRTLSTASFRKIGCGCYECNEIDHFLLSDTVDSRQIFRQLQAKRTHLIARLHTADDICTYTIIRSGKPHGIRVTKRKASFDTARWRAKQDAARRFLDTIGTDVAIASIMGSRFGDVMKALDGSQKYIVRPGGTGSGTNSGPRVSDSTPKPEPTTTPPSSLSTSSGPHAGPTSVAGVKRKQPNTPDVIDLTDL